MDTTDKGFAENTNEFIKEKLAEVTPESQDTGTTIDSPLPNRKDKIRELKLTIHLAGEDLKVCQEEYRALRAIEDTAPEVLNAKIALLGQKRGIIQSLTEELSLTRMNKHNSKFFEFHSSPMNRATKRRLRKSLNIK